MLKLLLVVQLPTQIKHAPNVNVIYSPQLEEKERDGGMEGAVGEERKERPFRTTLFQHGSGLSGTGSSLLLHSSGDEQRAKSNVHNFELERYFRVGHEFEFGNKLEQEQVSDHGQELKWTEQTGSDVDSEVGGERCEGWQEGLGFRPVGGLQRHWLVRQAQNHFQSGVRKGKERGSREKRDSSGQGGLRIHHPVEVKHWDIISVHVLVQLYTAGNNYSHFTLLFSCIFPWLSFLQEHYEGVPFHRARENLSSQGTGGFAEIVSHSVQSIILFYCATCM